jgi:hypothetical protein
LTATPQSNASAANSTATHIARVFSPPAAPSARSVLLRCAYDSVTIARVEYGITQQQ